MADETPARPSRGRRATDRRLGPRGGPFSAIWYVLALFLLLALGQFTYLSLQGGQTLSYSDFKQRLRQGRIQDVLVGEDRIRGTIRDEKGAHPFAVVRIDDPKLVEDLDKAGVKYTGEPANRWLTEVLSWIVPLIFLAALWGSFFRRMGTAEGGVMSCARSRAKVYADDDLKVRLGEVACVDGAGRE